MQSEPPKSGSPGAGRPSRLLLGLVGLCCLIELVLVASDFGLIGSRIWRGMAYQNGAFWSGLLRDWRPNYAAQPWTMFVSYAFLHGGFWHLAGNMVMLVVLGGVVEDRVGQGGLLAIGGLSAIGGAAGFALLNSSPQPMVGASGVLFGLAGAWQYWELRDRQAAGQGLWPVARTVLWLVVLNVVFWVIMGGVLAWETHLAGFVAGWLGAVALEFAKRR